MKKKTISGFARRGVKHLGYEKLNQSQLDHLYQQTGQRSTYLRKMSRHGFVYGTTNTTVRSWGFPGSSVGDGRIRHESRPTWDVFPYTDIRDKRKLVNTGVLTRVYSDGRREVSEKEVKILNTTIAQQLNIIRGRGVFKKFKFPKSDIPEFTWLMPSRYLRSEGYMVIEPGTAVWTGSNSNSKYSLTVSGHSSYITLSNMSDSTELRKHWSLSAVSKFHLMQVARSRALQKIRRSDIELSVALAESRKTATHLAKTAVDLFKAYRAVKRGDFKELRRICNWGWGTPIQKGAKFKYEVSQGKRTPVSEADMKLHKKLFYATKEPAKRWLELQYAWGPLLGDVNGAIKTLTKESRQQMTFKATGSIRENFNYTVNSKPNDPERHELHVAAGYSVAKCIVHYAVTDPASVLIAEMGVNPLLAVWEVVPWSFVVDWFTNIGDFLETMDVAMGKEFISGSETYYTVINRESRMPIQRISFPVSPLLPNGGSSAVTSHFMSVSRQPLTKWPGVGAYIKNPLTTNHVLNAIALARTLKK